MSDDRLTKLETRVRHLEDAQEIPDVLYHGTTLANWRHMQTTGRIGFFARLPAAEFCGTWAEAAKYARGRAVGRNGDAYPDSDIPYVVKVRVTYKNRTWFSLHPGTGHYHASCPVPIECVIRVPAIEKRNIEQLQAAMSALSQSRLTHTRIGIEHWTEGYSKSERHWAAMAVEGELKVYSRPRDRRAGMGPYTPDEENRDAWVEAKPTNPHLWPWAILMEDE